MRVDPDDMTGTVRTVTVRNTFRRLPPRFTRERLLSVLSRQADQPAGDHVWDELVRHDLIQPDENRTPPLMWCLTSAGVRLQAASAARPVKRATAERNVAALLERVEQVNADDTFAFVVDQVLLFGSMLDADLDQVNDVDIGLVLHARHTDRDEQRAAERRRAAHRRDSSIVGALMWPSEEVLRAVRGTSRVIQIVHVESLLDVDAPHRVIFDRER